MPDLAFSLGWVIAYVEDPPAVSGFYQETFGLPEDFTVPDGSYAQLDTGATKLAFASYALGDQNVAVGVHRASVAGAAPNVQITLVADDVDRAYEIALAAGCTSLAAPEDKPQGQRVAFLRDPFGIFIELATPL